MLGLLAAILLVIAGATSVATAAECDPAPPDCRMMSQDAQHAHQPGSQPAKGDPDTGTTPPCDQVLACQAGPAVQPALQAASPAPGLAWEAAEHDWLEQPPTRSRPPDETLRPPIQVILFV